MKLWMGTPPVKCDTCSGKISGTFVDGKTKMGPWACMCDACHKRLGCGLGTGKGQKYTQDQEGRWVKVAG